MNYDLLEFTVAQATFEHMSIDELIDRLTAIKLKYSDDNYEIETLIPEPFYVNVVEYETPGERDTRIEQEILYKNKIQHEANKTWKRQQKKFARARSKGR